MTSIMLVGSYAPSLLNLRLGLIREARRRGVAVFACAPPVSDDDAETLRSLGVRFFPIPMERRRTSPMSDLLTAKAIAKHLIQLRPTILLPYTAKPVLLAAVAHIATSNSSAYVPLLTGLGALEPHLRRNSWPVGRLAWRAIDRASAVVVQNTDDEEFIRERRPQASIIRSAGSGVDVEFFRSGSLPKGPCRFAMISRLIREKGVMEFVAAAAILRRRGVEAEFTLAGPLESGPGAISPSELLRECQLAGVDFVGELDDVRPTLESHHVVVSPSYYREGQPRILLEGLAMGRAVVTTDHIGCRETIRHGIEGLLVRPKDVDSLSDALGALAHDPQLVRRMGTAARRRAVTVYDEAVVNERLLDELEKTLRVGSSTESEVP